MEPLVVICPQCGENPRLTAVLQCALMGLPHQKIRRAEDLHPLRGRRVLFAISLTGGGINLGWYAMLSAIRQDPGFFEGCSGAVLVDGDGELYTKSAARELVFAANQAGCAFMGAPLVEATGSLQNFKVRAMLRKTDCLSAYTACAAELMARLMSDAPPAHRHPRLMVLHASNRKTSNTIALWERMAPQLEGRVDTQVVNLRNGTVADCNGCEFRTCLHFGEEGRCFYGGVIVDEVYPAITQADGVLWLCPNYNDALAANLTACINRLTALFRTTPFYDKELYGIIVSGYSGGDIVAQQLISALCMNKAFRLPPRFCLLETANDAGAAVKLPGIDRRLADFAAHMFS